MPLFGERGIPATGQWHQTFLFLTVDQLRKVSTPISMVTQPGFVLGAILSGSCVFQNYSHGVPLMTGFPRTVFAGVAGLYIGYYCTRLAHQKFLGKFKYYYEYALSRKDQFPTVARTKFGDPKHLSHWDPPRDLYN